MHRSPIYSFTLQSAPHLPLGQVGELLCRTELKPGLVSVPIQAPNPVRDLSDLDVDVGGAGQMNSGHTVEVNS